MEKCHFLSSTASRLNYRSFVCVTSDEGHLETLFNVKLLPISEQDSQRKWYYQGICSSCQWHWCSLPWTFQKLSLIPLKSVWQRPGFLTGSRNITDYKWVSIFLSNFFKQKYLRICFIKVNPHDTFLLAIVPNKIFWSLVWSWIRPPCISVFKMQLNMSALNGILMHFFLTPKTFWAMEIILE